MKKQSFFTGMLLIAAIFIFSGCAGKNTYMKEVPDDAINLSPNINQVSVIFMRPSGFGFAISSSVFDVTEKENIFVGIVSAQKKIVYKTNPGEHMFMVVSESADFMTANLESEKTYYALVTPRMGVWKARFSLKPVSNNELSSKEFKDWLSSTSFTENTESAFDWAKQNAKSIQSKKEKYLQDWNQKAEGDKPFLRPEDGM